MKFPLELANLRHGDCPRFRLRPHRMKIRMLLRRARQHLPRQPQRQILQRLRAIARQQIRMPHAPMLNGGSKTCTKFISAKGHGNFRRNYGMNGIQSASKIGYITK